MGHTILLADDSITIQKVIELTFSDEDFKLHTVSNGQKAIDEIRAVKPDIVLCDIIMPEKNGYEVCEFIKTNADLKHIPVLLLTGAFEPFDQERARQAGCDGFLAKPFEPQTLISKVRELLAAAKRPAAAPARPVPPSAPATPPRPAAAPAAPVVEAEATVVFPFSQQSGPQATPPPADVVQDFAYEVGDRELAVDPGDRNLFIEPEENAENAEHAESAHSAVSEDIWGQVQQAQQAPSPAAPMADEGATVMMQTPPPSHEPPPKDFVGGAGFDELVAPASSFEPPPADAEATPEPAEPELTPMGDFGFDAFSATDQGGAAARPDADAGEATMLFTEPPAASAGSPWESAASTSPTSSAWQETAPSSGWGADEEAGGTVWEREPMPLSPTWEEQAPASTPAAPAWEEPAVPAEAWEDAVPATVWEETAIPAAEATPAARPATSAPAAPQPSVAPAPAPEPAWKEEPVAQTRAAQTMPGGSSGPAIDSQQLDELAEKVAQKIISKISAKMIQEIAWEVVPDLAETLIRKEIEALKAKIPR